MAAPRVLIVRAPGANCDGETQFAFERAGGVAARAHINRLREEPAQMQRYQILVVPGGFTYGDDVAAGKILANQLSHFLGDALRKFRDADKLILGVCNGFQVLLKAGLLMPPDEDGPLATLTNNANGRFEDRWVYLQATPGNCPFLTGCERLHLPVAHGEGNFICREPWMLKGLEQSGQVVLRYVDEQGKPGPFPINPNGSQGDVAGLCDATGRVLGLMPHPERHVLPTQHPRWTRDGLAEEGDGLRLFRNAVEYFHLMAPGEKPMLDDSGDWGKPPPLESAPVPLGKRVGGFLVRNIYNILIAAIAALCIVGGWWLLHRPPNVSRENFEKIKEGMAERDVSAILGPESSMKDTSVPMIGHLDDKGKPVQAEWRVWRNAKGEILIAFVNGKVRGKYFRPP